LSNCDNDSLHVGIPQGIQVILELVKELCRIHENFSTRCFGINLLKVWQ
jgi:hypothetical protein